MRCARFIASWLILLAFLGGAEPKPPKSPDVVIIEDIVYRTVDNEELKLDVAMPGRGNGPFPLIVCIHGGGWRVGDKGGYRSELPQFARRNYVAASIDYRLAPKYKFPAPLEDGKAAIRFLRANAVQYKIDPAYVGLLGDSAGGNLSCLLGLIDPADGFADTGDCLEQPSSVQAVVNYYGGFNFQTWKMPRKGDQTLQRDLNRSFNGLLEDYLGTSDRADPRMAMASPATYADADDPPVLTFQGTEDVLVPLEQGEEFHKALTAAGVKSELKILNGAGHGWGGERKAITMGMTLTFFDKHLKKKQRDGSLIGSSAFRRS